MEIDRRGFLILSGAALLQAGLTRAAEEADAAAGVPWHQKIKRIGQINMNERDPVELDVNAWADYWAELKVDAVLVSVTGIVAFYPTQIPYHRKTPFLGTRDFFGDCCNAAKKRGIRVIARLSPDLQWEEAATAHPEWFRRHGDGLFVPHPEAPELLSTCMFTSYFTEQIPAIMREVNSRYDVDGIFTNAWPPLAGLPICSCAACQTAPAPRSPAFYERHLNRTIELWKMYDGIAREKKADNIYFGNLGGGTGAAVNLKSLGEYCNWFNCDNQGRGGEETPAWGCAQQGRVARSVMKGKTITNVTGAWSTGKVKWRNSAKAAAEAEMWMAQTAASGMTIWYHWLGGQSGMGEDRRWMETGRRFFSWMAKHDEHFTYKRSLAKLGVVWAQRPNAFYAPPGGGTYSEFMQGLYSMLLEGRFLFDFVHEDDLGADMVGNYAALLLPNVALLSDGQCGQLADYVKAGGSLLSTFETGMYDSAANRRNEFGLAELFGIRRNGDVKGPNGNSFFARIEQAHPILDGFSDTKILPGAEYRQPFATASGGPAVLTVIPPYTAYPPELSYSRTPHTNEPAVAIQETGASRLIHFCGDVERTAWRSGNADVSRLIQNSIRWLMRDAPAVSVEGDGLAELFAWETEAGYALHVLNYTNPNLHKGWIRKSYGIGEQNVRMEIPAGRRIARVELLRAGVKIPFVQEERSVRFTIPKVADYEVAAVSM